MNRLILLLIIFASVAQPSARINQAASKWPSECNPLPHDTAKPDFEDLKLDDILAAGVFHMNWQNRKLNNNGSLGATFVFGTPGSGKSIVTPLIFGDLDKLGAGLSKSNSSVIYRKENQIGDRSTESMLRALLPEYYLFQHDNFSKTGFWDCSGFGNSRGSKADIAQMYFLKHALEISEQVKFIFTITHSSIMEESGVRMLGIYATSLIKDIGKFKDSIGLVVTEVNNRRARGEDDILRSIRDFIKTYIDTENNIIKEEKEGEKGRGGKESSQRKRQIDFLKGLIEEEIDGGSAKINRLELIHLQECGTLSNMPVVSDTIEKFRVLVRSLKHSTIGPGDFGWPLRNETLRKIGHPSRQDEEREMNKFAVESARGIMKGLERALLSSQNEMSMLQMINGFHLAFDHHFGQLLGKGRASEWNMAGKMEPSYTDIDFFFNCASQRIKTAQFVQQVIRDGSNDTSDVPTSSEPFRIAHSGLNTLSVFYSFLNKTLQALGEYTTQRSLRQMKIDGVIDVNIDNVLNILGNVSIEITDQIRAIWKYKLGAENKKYLVALVRKQIAECKLTCIHKDLYGGKFRWDFIGRNVILSDVLAMQLNKSNRIYCDPKGPALDDFEVNIVALEKLYVDVDLGNILHGIAFVSIVAPIWEVIASEIDKNVRIIDLNGKSRLASNGWGSLSGKAENAGSFIGVYSNIIKSTALYISTTGGDNDCGTGGNDGTIVLISTRRNLTVNTDSCPGSGRYPGGVQTGAWQPTYGITDYNKEYVRSLLLDCLSSPESEELYQGLVRHSEPISTLSLAEELQAVERDYYARGDHIHNCPGRMKKRLVIYYERTLNVINKQLAQAGPDEKLALTLIGGFLIGKLTTYRRLDMTQNVISTEDYLTAVEEELEELEKLAYKVAINKQIENLKGALNEKVNEAQKIIRNVIKPAIERAEQMVKQMQKQLFATLEAFLKEAKDIKKELEVKKKQYQALLPLKHFMSILNVAGKVMSFLAPIEPDLGLDSVGTVAKELSSIGTYFLDDNFGLPLMPLSVQLPNDSDENYQKYIDKYFEEKNIKKSEEKKKRMAKAMKAVALTGTGILVGGPLGGLVGAALFKEIASNNEQLENLEMAIETGDMQVKEIKKLKDKFLSSFVPELNRISSNIGAVTSNLSGTSHSGLIAKNWGITRMLKNMRRQVKGFAGWISKAQNVMIAAERPVPGVPEVYEQFQCIINDLQETLEVYLQLYTQIETYQERKEMAQFIADVNSPYLGNVADIKNKKLQKAVERIELSIKINLVLEKYKKARHAFMQWVFPFPSLYITPKNDLIGKAAKSFEGVVRSCRKEINKYRIQLKKYNAQSTSRDEYVYYYNFTNDTVTSKPFYTWTNDKWQDAISRLLKGESIRLKADVDMIGHENAKFFRDKAAIKFKSIGLSLKTHKKSHQGELNSVLKHFWISMDHSGVSHYNVNGQQFVMRDKPQSYRYNFERGIDQTSVRKKVEGPSSDFLMSPYTWWTFKLRNLTKNGFADLEKFATHVDLALEGSGTYLDEAEAGTVALNELNLSEYYEIYQPGDDETEELAEISHRRCTQAQLFHNRSPQSTNKDFNQGITGRSLQSNRNSTWQRWCSREIQTYEKTKDELIAAGCNV